MSYNLYTSNSWKSLLGHLTLPGDGPRILDDLFGPRPVVIPQSELVKRWIELRLADMGRVLTPDWKYPKGVFKSALLQLAPEKFSEAGLISNQELALKAYSKDSGTIGVGGWYAASDTAALINHYADNFPEVLESWNHPLWITLWKGGRAPLGWWLHQAVKKKWTKKEAVLPEILVLGSSFLSFTQQNFLLYLSEFTQIGHYLLGSASLEVSTPTSENIAFQTLQNDPRVRHTHLESETPPVKVYSCGAWGRRRELEEAADKLIEWLEIHPEAELHDVALMAVDWEPYAVFAEEVFGSRFSGKDQSPLGGPTLELLSEDLASDKEILRGRLLSLLLRTGTETWTRSLLEELVTHPWTVKLGWAEDAAQRWDDWAETCGWHWAGDASERKNLSPELDGAFSLDEAWSRFCLTLWGNSQLPTASWSDLQTYGSVYQTLSQLRRTWNQAFEKGELGSFALTWKTILETWVTPSDPDWVQKNLLTPPDDFLAMKMTVKDFTDLVQSSWSRQGYQPQLLVRGISAGSLNRLRSIPFKVVVLLGMDEGFPRGDVPLADDILYEEQENWPGLLVRRDSLGRHLGDIRLWDNARNAAKEEFWVFFTSRDREKGEPIPPTPLLKNLPKNALVQTELYHWEGSGSTHFTSYAEIGASLSQADRGKESLLDWDRWRLEPAKIRDEAIVKSWAEPLVFFLERRFGWKALNFFEEDADEEPWDLNDFYLTDWFMLTLKDRGFSSVDWASSLLGLITDLTGQGKLSKHFLHPPWIEEKTQDFLAWSKSISDILESDQPKILLWDTPRMFFVAEKGGERIAFCFQYSFQLKKKPHHKEDFLHKVLQLWVQTEASLALNMNVSKVALLGTKKIDKKDEVVFSAEVLKDLTIEQALGRRERFLHWQGVFESQPWPIFYDIFDGKLLEKTADEVWKEALDAEQGMTNVKQRWVDALEFIRGGLDMDSTPPYEFVHLFNEWKTEFLSW